jgi:hypothetical protein
MALDEVEGGVGGVGCTSVGVAFLRRSKSCVSALFSFAMI